MQLLRQTAFAQWVLAFGVTNLVDAMRARGHSVTVSAVYYWLRGVSEPLGPKVRELARLANGTISVQDVHDHFALAEQLRAGTEALPTPAGPADVHA